MEVGRVVTSGRPLAARSPIVYKALAIQSVVPSDSQDEVFRLLGLVWSGAPSAEISVQRTRLLALQGDAGGWSQKPGLVADAYATGPALYALHVGGLAELIAGMSHTCSGTIVKTARGMCIRER